MKRTKTNVEFLLVKAELKGVPEKGLLKSRNIGQVDLIWPRSCAHELRPSAARRRFLRAVGARIATRAGLWYNTIREFASPS